MFDARERACRYVRSLSFWVDWVSACPFDLVAFANGHVQVAYYIRLLKFVRLWKARRYLESFETCFEYQGKP